MKTIHRTIMAATRLPDWRTLVVSLLMSVTLPAGVLVVAGVASDAHAENLVSLTAPKRLAAIKVALGKSEDVRTDQTFIDIALGDPEIADINPLTDKSISILGKKIGTTRVSIYGDGKRLVGVFDVEVSYDITALSREIARRFPQAGLKVTSVNGRIMLYGTAPDGVVLDRALVLARQFGAEVINSVEVAAAQQVMLEVRFVEASRQAGRELGVQWNVLPRAGSANRFLTNIGDNKGAGALPQVAGTDGTVTSLLGTAAGVIGTATPPYGFLVGNLIAKGLNIDVALNALEEKGLARRLAEPNLVALSGDTANFLAGGEYPIPVPGTFGQISVDYKKYGVGLAFTPTVLSGGQINLKIEPEVSQLDPTNKVAVGTGVTVPALTVRRASSTLELRDGQSFVMAGLLQSDSATVQQQLPWIGDVPVLGALFSSKSYQKSETDLVIIVTPHIVQPSRPGDIVRTPLDNTLPANDPDFFLLGKAEIPRKELRKNEASGENNFVGHILDLPAGARYVLVQ